MTEVTRPARGVLGRPTRVAAVGGAAAVCVLSVAGALGLVPSGPADANPAVHSTTASGTHSPGGPVQPGSGLSAGGAGAEQPPAHQPASTGTGTGTGTSTSSSDTVLPADSGTGKRIVFDVSAQRVWLVTADDTVARTYPVSGSRFHNLDLGTYQVYSRSRKATAYNSDETMSYMVRFTTGRTSPIGFHSIPALPGGGLVETRAELGTPLSAGCIRQWITDARALWNFAPDGTTVVVRA